MNLLSVLLSRDIFDKSLRAFDQVVNLFKWLVSSSHHVFMADLSSYDRALCLSFFLSLAFSFSCNLHMSIAFLCSIHSAAVVSSHSVYLQVTEY